MQQPSRKQLETLLNAAKRDKRNSEVTRISVLLQGLNDEDEDQPAFALQPTAGLAAALIEKGRRTESRLVGVGPEDYLEEDARLLDE